MSNSCCSLLSHASCVAYSWPLSANMTSSINRKHITKVTPPKESRSNVHNLLVIGHAVMRFQRYARRQADTQTDKHTDRHTFITILLPEFCVSDPKSTCGVISSPPIRGQNVTLSCIVSYNRKSDRGTVNPRTTISASVSWESAAGMTISRSSTPLANNVGETLQVDVQQVPTGTEIPAYNCTAVFSFAVKKSTRTKRDRERFVYAVNDLSWTCVSEPVLTWCKYLPAAVTSIFVRYIWFRT